MNEVLAQKVTSLQRCVSRAREARADAGADFRTSYNLQDAAVLNVIRACDTAIDLANMLIRRRRLGIPSESRESFADVPLPLMSAFYLECRISRLH